MTREQAFEKLELPNGSDLQSIRKRFAEMHNDYRMQIDNAFNPISKQKFEQKLEELKEAYALLNESEGIDDNAELPRTAQSTRSNLEQQHDTQAKQAKEWSINEALALFGLKSDQEISFIRQGAQKYLDELKNQYHTASLPFIKDACQQELDKAEKAFSVIQEWLEKRMSDEQQQQRQQQTYSSTDDSINDHEQNKSKNKSKLIYGIGILVLLVVVGYYFLNFYSVDTSKTLNDDDRKRDSIAWEAALVGANLMSYEHYLKQYPEGIFGTQAKDSINRINLKETSSKVPSKDTDNDKLQSTSLKKNTESVKEVVGSTNTSKDANKIFEKAEEFYNTKKYQEAAELYKQGASLNHLESIYSLGYIYESGKGVSQNYPEAIRWYQKAADRNHPASLFALSVCYRHGRGVTKDSNKEFYWCQKAAEAGVLNAQYQLGRLYYYGTGIGQDYSKALYWYQKAADRGDAEAYNNLGLMHENGEGVSKDLTKAIKLYQEGANRGDKTAALNLKRLGVTN